MIKLTKKLGDDIDALKKKIDYSNFPEHIAIIMDGNGRWAKKRLLPRSAGHKEGVKRVREIVKECGDLGIKYLTIYAFSTENWNRPKDEVNYLMKLLLEFLNKEVDTLHRNNVKINVLGNINRLDDTIKTGIKKAMKITGNNNKLILNIALNYGGRDEIVTSIKSIINDYDNNLLNINDIDEELVSNYLFTKNQPDPNLLIRTSGEIRISNFLLYQLAYTEFWFTDINWPEFTKKYLYKAILDYQDRNRRFGKL